VRETDEAVSVDRRCLFKGVGAVLFAGTIASAASSLWQTAEGRPATSRKGMTSEVRLIDDYNSWLVRVFGNAKRLREGLPRYITETAVLREAASLPWGGTLVGYAGWESLNERGMAALGGIPEMSIAHYWQRGNVVLREFTLTIKPTKPTKANLVVDIIEKYTVENGRITQIDLFYDDTATLLKWLALDT
jgi:hypothetical protein